MISRRKRKNRLVSGLLIIAMMININAFTAHAITSSGTARIYYLSSLSCGLTTSIKNRLTSYGYSASVTADPSTAALSSALCGSNKIVFVHTHGGYNPPRLRCASNALLYASNLSSSNLKFAYLSACYSAKYDSSLGYSFRSKMTLLGVPMTVGFTGVITASTDSNKIHYFNDRVFLYLTNGHTLSNAIHYAKADTYSLYHSYCGAETIEYSGSGSYLP